MYRSGEDGEGVEYLRELGGGQPPACAARSGPGPHHLPRHPRRPKRRHGMLLRGSVRVGGGRERERERG